MRHSINSLLVIHAWSGHGNGGVAASIISILDVGLAQMPWLCTSALPLFGLGRLCTLSTFDRLIQITQLEGFTCAELPLLAAWAAEASHLIACGSVGTSVTMCSRGDQILQKGVSCDPLNT